MNNEPMGNVAGSGVAVRGGSVADVRPLALAAQGLIAVQAVLQLLVGAAGGSGSRYFGQYGLVAMPLLAATVVVFLCWFRRCRLNAEVFAPGTHRFSPGFAVGGWFIPVAMWWIPHRTARDIWKASGPAEGAWLVDAWWVAWLAKTVGAAVVWTFESHPNGYSLYDQLVGVVAAALAILLIGKVTARQQAAGR